MKPRPSRVKVCIVLALALLITEARAQQPSKIHQIGFVSYGAPAESANRVRALRMGLRDHGYVEDKNINLLFRWAETAEQLPGLAADLVRLNVDVIVAPPPRCRPCAVRAGAPVTLTGRLLTLDFSQGVADASWTFQFELRSSNGQWVTVLERYPIAGGDPGACRQTARALMPAVQQLVAKIVRHPGFARLLNATRWREEVVSIDLKAHVWPLGTRLAFIQTSEGA